MVQCMWVTDRSSNNKKERVLREMNLDVFKPVIYDLALQLEKIEKK